jgi:hypothetical protein
MDSGLGAGGGGGVSNGGGGGTGSTGGGVGLEGDGTAEPIFGRVAPESRVFPLLVCRFGTHFVDFLAKVAIQFFPIWP